MIWLVNKIFLTWSHLRASLSYGRYIAVLDRFIAEEEDLDQYEKDNNKERCGQPEYSYLDVLSPSHRNCSSHYHTLLEIIVNQ